MLVYYLTGLNQIKRGEGSHKMRSELYRATVETTNPINHLLITFGVCVKRLLSYWIKTLLINMRERGLFCIVCSRDDFMY